LCGGDVHAHDKYRYNRLFLENTKIKRFLTLQYSRVPGASLVPDRWILPKSRKKPHILPLEWKLGFEGFVRVETGEMPFGPDTGRVRNVIHPGSFRALISGIRTGSPGSTGNRVHAHRKSRVKRLFSENTQFKWFLILQNSGLLRVSFSHS
jgi:hypothetical protein